MKRTTTLTGLALTAALALTACGGTAEDPDASTSASATSTGTASAAASPSSTGSASEGMNGGGMHHHPDGGPPPAGIEPAAGPAYPVGTTVTLTADHMPGMQGAEATITGAFDTTAYSVTYTPTTGGEPVVDHRWVVHEELQDPAEPPLESGTQVVLEAEHMAGMQGAEATIESSTDETVYMVDLTMDGIQMTNHQWVVDSEIQPAR
ncbi:YdhK family protein [Citricoccus nitrophenolicus]|uniref:YdhK family protein n=1 Tax=Citricoccus nitrophenolicus TaxID=863575 RepID=A0ABV0ING6_9MICC|nr:YdhK family protein [Citricoccus sp. I39-566]WMY79730.1 YdhK family protein [Citricoccus sp. I39-566]